MLKLWLESKPILPIIYLGTFCLWDTNSQQDTRKGKLSTRINGVMEKRMHLLLKDLAVMLRDVGLGQSRIMLFDQGELGLGARRPRLVDRHCHIDPRVCSQEHEQETTNRESTAKVFDAHFAHDGIQMPHPGCIYCLSTLFFGIKNVLDH